MNTAATIFDQIPLLQRIGDDRHACTAHTHHLSVTVTDGIVDLWGYAESGEERKAIRVIAEAVPGVTMVNDHLAVSSTFLY